MMLGLGMGNVLPLALMAGIAVQPGTHSRGHTSSRKVRKYAKMRRKMEKQGRRASRR